MSRPCPRSIDSQQTVRKWIALRSMTIPSSINLNKYCKVKREKMYYIEAEGFQMEDIQSSKRSTDEEIQKEDIRLRGNDPQLSAEGLECFTLRNDDEIIWNTKKLIKKQFSQLKRLWKITAVRRQSLAQISFRRRVDDIHRERVDDGFNPQFGRLCRMLEVDGVIVDQCYRVLLAEGQGLMEQQRNQPAVHDHGRCCSDPDASYTAGYLAFYQKTYRSHRCMYVRVGRLLSNYLLFAFKLDLRR